MTIKYTAITLNERHLYGCEKLLPGTKSMKKNTLGSSFLMTLQYNVILYKRTNSVCLRFRLEAPACDRYRKVLRQPACMSILQSVRSKIEEAVPFHSGCDLLRETVHFGCISEI